MLDELHTFHFIGIGGAGMSAVAEVLLEEGYGVSGSDIHESTATARLQQQGAHIFIGHDGLNLGKAEAVVISTAIHENNPELQAARARGLKVFHRSEIVAALMAEKSGIAVAGAHGKTTTTSMLALLLEKAGLDPTIISGGELKEIGGNAKHGNGQYLVAEADESDGTFLRFAPQISVVTNIENDHMDHYKTMDNILKAFREFIANLPEDGLAVLCADSDNVRKILPDVQRRYITYGVDNEADYQAANIITDGPCTMYDVIHEGVNLGQIRLNVPGKHNVNNSLAAVVVGQYIGISFAKIAECLSFFYGAKRRFQTKGRANGIWVVDDYAHHPTEIATTLTAARQTVPQRLVCVFQPHRYSRTKLLRQDFGHAFKEADVLVITDVYAAGEEPIQGADGQSLVDEIAQQTGQKTVYIQDVERIVPYLLEIVEPGDLVITMGAGNIYQIGEQLVEQLQDRI